MNLARIAYIGCELKSRDLDARLYLAAHLLQHGITVIVGQQWAIWKNANTMPRGCVLLGTANAVQARKAMELKRLGHAVAVSDEEAMALVAPEHILANVEREALAACNAFMANGEVQADAIARAFPDLAEKIVVTGSPRADLLTMPGLYQDEVAAIRSDVGPFILFNSNFAMANCLMGNVHHLKPEEAKARGIRFEFLPWEMENVRQMHALIRWCHDHMTDHAIVIRPHPAEVLEPWRAEFGSYPRVSILTGTAPVPWIMASDIVVHTNCTTGLEAALLGKPAINISPDPNAELHEAFVMKHVNVTVPSASAAASYISSGAWRAEPVYPTGIVGQILSGVRSRWAGNAVASLISKILASATDTADHSDLNLRRIERHDFQRSKFTVTVQEAFKRLQCISAALPDIDVTMKELDDSLFLLTPKCAAR